MKKCTKCHTPKPLDKFHKKSTARDGRTSHCAECRNTYNKKVNSEIGHDVLYRMYDTDKRREKRKAYYQKNKEKVIKRTAEWRKNNPKECKARRSAEYEKYKEKAIENAKAWVSRNPCRRKEIAAEHSRRVRKDPNKKPAIIARKMMSRILECTGRKKRGKTFDILGYNKQQLKEHIEEQFEEGMNWENHGQWHVDHIVPVSVMIDRGETDPAVINSLSNLQPLWAHENLSKSNKIPCNPR